MFPAKQCSTFSKSSVNKVCYTRLLQEVLGNLRGSACLWCITENGKITCDLPAGKKQGIDSFKPIHFELNVTRPKKVALFPEIGQVKNFLSLTRPHRRVRIYNFNFKKQTKKTNKNTKKAKETKEEKRIAFFSPKSRFSVFEREFSSSVVLINFEHISYLFLEFLLTSNKRMFARSMSTANNDLLTTSYKLLKIIYFY